MKESGGQAGMVKRGKTTSLLRGGRRENGISGISVRPQEEKLEKREGVTKKKETGGFPGPDQGRGTAKIARFRGSATRNGKRRDLAISRPPWGRIGKSTYGSGLRTIGPRGSHGNREM